VTAAYARGGLVVGPDGSDSVPWFPMEREAIVDRHGRVICRYVGGRWIRRVDVERFIRERIVAASGPADEDGGQ
jgi:hypothetical protein